MGLVLKLTNIKSSRYFYGVHVTLCGAMNVKRQGGILWVVVKSGSVGMVEAAY